MKAPALSPNESERLADLYDHGILDATAERVFAGNPERLHQVVVDFVSNAVKFAPAVFQRIAQADMQTNRRNGGSGLGLSIAQQMTELSASIGYDSEPGRAVFHATFPRTPA